MSERRSTCRPSSTACKSLCSKNPLRVFRTSIEGMYGRDQMVTAYQWTVDLKDRGFGKVPSGSGGDTPSDGKPGPDEKTK